MLALRWSPRRPGDAVVHSLGHPEDLGVAARGVLASSWQPEFKMVRALVALHYLWSDALHQCAVALSMDLAKATRLLHSLPNLAADERVHSGRPKHQAGCGLDGEWSQFV